MRTLFRLFPYLMIMSAVFALSGCAFKKKSDPLEGINRGVYVLNKTADALFLKPVATAATKFLPDIVLGGIDNFFENLAQLPVLANKVLQLKFKEARIITARLIINSTWGIGGLFDFATSHAKLEKQYADFGQTLALYGYKDSIYIVLPFFGPSTIRDGIGRGVDLAWSVWPYIEPEHLGWKLYGVYVVDIRAKSLKKEEVLKEAAVDEYILVREAYLQNRRYQFGQESAMEDDEGKWSPLEDDLEKEIDKEEKETDKEKPQKKDDLETKMNMTPEELEEKAKQEEASKKTPIIEDTTDIKGPSTLPAEKRDPKQYDLKNNR